jgi:hypothetical protein
MYPAARPKKKATGMKRADKEEPLRLARFLDILIDGL